MIFVVLISVFLVLQVCAIYLLWRNDKVHDFLKKLADKCFQCEIRDIRQYKNGKQLDIAERLVDNYKWILFSVKPLTEEAWLTQEEIQAINS